MAPVHIYHPLADAHADNAPCITALFRSGGPGTVVQLVPRAVYALQTPIDLVHDRTTLETAGSGLPSLPRFLLEFNGAPASASTGGGEAGGAIGTPHANVHDGQGSEQAVLETRGERESVAIKAVGLSRVTVRRVHVRGCRGWGAVPPRDDDERERQELKRTRGARGWVEGGGALILLGGPGSTEATLEGCRLEDPRGWSALHVIDFAQDAVVANNVVGPCGQQAPGGPWADGLSIAGKDTIVSGNTIFDATDGQIVLFCATRSLVTNNTIVSFERTALGAINMVDDFPIRTKDGAKGDFERTRVVGNSIQTLGGAGYIRLAIGCGPTCWSPWQPTHRLNTGGVVRANALGPGTFGYGIAVSGCERWVAQGNFVVPGARFEGDTAKCVTNAPPTPFLVAWREKEQDKRLAVECDLQPEFKQGTASYLIGIEPGLSERLLFEAGQLALDWTTTDCVRLRGGASWRLGPRGQLELSDGGAALWSSPLPAGESPRQPVDPKLSFVGGRLKIQDGERTLWDPTSYLPPSVQLDDPRAQGHPTLLLSSLAPFLVLRDASQNVVFSSHYAYDRGAGWHMACEDWIAIAPPALRGGRQGPPPVPPKPSSHGFRGFMRDMAQGLEGVQSQSQPPRQDAPTYLFISAQTSQVILHSGPSPTEPGTHVHWCAPPHPSTARQNTWLNFQGDGNLVLYAQNEQQGVHARWASGTNGPPERIGQTLVLKGVADHGGPRLEIFMPSGERFWSS